MLALDSVLSKTEVEEELKPFGLALDLQAEAAACGG